MNAVSRLENSIWKDLLSSVRDQNENPIQSMCASSNGSAPPVSEGHGSFLPLLRSAPNDWLSLSVLQKLPILAILLERFPIGRKLFPCCHRAGSHFD